MVTVAPSTGRPSSVRGLIRKYFASFRPAAPKPKSAGVSDRTLQLPTEPLAATWHCRIASPAVLIARARAVGVAAVVVGLSFLVLAGLSGGTLGGDRFDPVTVPAGLLAVSMFGWVAVVGSVVAWLTGRRRIDHPDAD